jgi:hypothetical protein
MQLPGRYPSRMHMQCHSSLDILRSCMHQSGFVMFPPACMLPRVAPLLAPSLNPMHVALPCLGATCTRRGPRPLSPDHLPLCRRRLSCLPFFGAEHMPSYFLHIPCKMFKNNQGNDQLQIRLALYPYKLCPKRTDKDITISDTTTPFFEVYGSITRSPAQRLNHQVNSFFCSSTINLENRLLTNDLIVIRNQAMDHEGYVGH